MPHQPDGSVHFAEKSFQDQLALLWQRGKVLETRRLPGFWLHLYALDTLFVEMWICQRRYEVSMLRLVMSTDELEPYLHQISLGNLIA